MVKKQGLDVNAYPFTVRRLPEDEGGGFLVEYPDVPNCIADGKTVDEAVRHGREVLEACLATLAEFGKYVPQPDSKISSGQWRQRVPRSLHSRLVERAEREGVSLNTLVTALIAEGMGRRDPSAQTVTISAKRRSRIEPPPPPVSRAPRNRHRAK